MRTQKQLRKLARLMTLYANDNSAIGSHCLVWLRPRNHLCGREQITVDGTSDGDLEMILPFKQYKHENLCI